MKKIILNAIEKKSLNSKEDCETFLELFNSNLNFTLENFKNKKSSLEVIEDLVRKKIIKTSINSEKNEVIYQFVKSIEIYNSEHFLNIFSKEKCLAIFEEKLYEIKKIPYFDISYKVELVPISDDEFEEIFYTDDLVSFIKQNIIQLLIN